MATYVYKKTTGVLVSWGKGDDMPVADEGVLKENDLVVIRGLPAMDQLHVWDEATRTIVDVDPLTLKRFLTSAQFVLSFTPEEFAAIRASMDARIQQFFLALQVSQEIDTHGATTMGALDYLVSKGLLTADRATVIKG